MTVQIATDSVLLREVRGGWTPASERLNAFPEGELLADLLRRP